MKINRIMIDNFLGVQTVDVRTSTPITLFAGANHSGKSSIAEAVKMAITRDHVRGVTVKKNFDALVHDGAKAGGAQVMAGDDNTFAFNMPNGVFTGPEVNDSMRVSLFGQRFAAMDAKERRTFLFDLTKCKPTAAAVKARLLAKGCEEAKIEAVLPLLRTGFPDTCDHAKGKAKEAKGAWGKVTGEQWGSVKAENWEAPAVGPVEGDAAALADQVTGFDRNIAKLNESLGAIRSEARAAADAASKREKLTAAPEQVELITKDLDAARAGLAQHEPAVAELRKRAAGAGKLTMADELAHFLASLPIPTLGKEWEESANAILRRYEAAGGDYGVAACAVDAKAQALLPSQEHGLKVLRDRVATLSDALAVATQAAAQFAALAPAVEAVDASARITEIEQMLTDAKAAHTVAENKRLDLEAHTRMVEAAKKKTVDAKVEHANVVAWSKLGDALAPDGIPAELLADALAPVNAALEQAAVDTEWARVQIGADMDITAAGRAYALLSVSEQWRTDAMIAQVVAELSGLKILMLDAVDVLDLPGRAQLFTWLSTLADLELVDTVLLFATLKALPTGLDDAVTPYWVQGGTIAGARVQEAA